MEATATVSHAEGNMCRECATWYDGVVAAFNESACPCGCDILICEECGCKVDADEGVCGECGMPVG